MGGIVTTEDLAPPRQRPSRRPFRFRPIQFLAAIGCTAVAILATAALMNLVLGRAPVPPTFRDPITVAHFAIIFSALPLSVIQLALPKGTGLHRIIGYTWCGALVAASSVSFGMHGINGGWSPPHTFAVISLICVPLIIYFARTHRTRAHSGLVLGFIIFFLVLAGGFTFIPGRALGSLLSAYWTR